MSWITEAQATNFLSPNSEWEAFDNKDDLLKLATNRLEQLDFRDEDQNRVGFRYIDGNSVSKVSAQDNFLLEANKGNFAYHEALGWERSEDDMDLFIHKITNSFLVNDNDDANYTFKQDLTLKQIQNLHSFGGEFKGKVALDKDDGSLGAYQSIETQQATAIVDADGDQVFEEINDRRLIVLFEHNGVNCTLAEFGGLPAVVFDGIEEVEAVNEQGETVTNTVPEILAGDFYTYKTKVIAENGLSGTMFLYVNDILIANPVFNENDGGLGGNRLYYQSGASTGTDRVSYIAIFGALINAEKPITIPIRLVGACALLAFEYGKFPPESIGDKAYLENENDYPRMQDLPINVQAAVEPFLAKYVQPRLLNEKGKPTRLSATSLEYE